MDAEVEKSVHFLLLVVVAVLLPSIIHQQLAATGGEILSKSKLERCIKASESDKLDCTKKIVINMAVPSGSVILSLQPFFVQH